MKISTAYVVMCDFGGIEWLFEATFRNEVDRNEMALALWEEYIYWLYTRISMREDNVNMETIEQMAHEAISLYETVLVEG